jgi:hypothetical protein
MSVPIHGSRNCHFCLRTPQGGMNAEYRTNEINAGRNKKGSEKCSTRFNFF